MKHVIAIIFSFVAMSAQAVDFELSLGQVKWTGPDKGIWYQPGPASEGFSTQMDLKSSAYSVGFTDYVSPNIRWRAGYANLGKAETKAWATSDDLDYDFENERCKPGCKMAYYHGHSSVSGAYATAVREINVGGVTVGPEFGFWAYVHKFSMSDDVLTPVKNKNKVSFGAVAGISIGTKSTSLVFRMYRVDPTSVEYPSITQKYARFVGFEHRF
jgi:hypothetical protein